MNSSLRTSRADNLLLAAIQAQEALRRAKFKFAGRQKIVVSRNWCDPHMRPLPIVTQFASVGRVSHNTITVIISACRGRHTIFHVHSQHAQLGTRCHTLRTFKILFEEDTINVLLYHLPHLYIPYNFPASKHSRKRQMGRLMGCCTQHPERINCLCSMVTFCYGMPLAVGHAVYLAVRVFTLRARLTGRGFTKFTRDDFIQWKKEGRLVNDGVNAKVCADLSCYAMLPFKLVKHGRESSAPWPDIGPNG